MSAGDTTLKSLSKTSEQLSSPCSEHEMFNGTNWEDFKVSMDAHFELFSIKEDGDRLHWFVSTMTETVKVIWAKFAGNRPCKVNKS